MPRFGLGHGVTASALVGFAVAACMAAQQLSNGAAFAETPRTYEVDTADRLSATTASLTTPAAVQAGEWERLYVPPPADILGPTPAPAIAPMPAATEGPKPSPFQSGIASTYGEGDGFEGNRTACGQIFRTRTVQVAHKTLPCGTVIRIEDADTGRTVDAEVTDRGPYIPGRVVDLSWGAFSQLEPSGPGLLRVNVYLLEQ